MTNKIKRAKTCLDVKNVEELLKTVKECWNMLKNVKRSLKKLKNVKKC